MNEQQPIPSEPIETRRAAKRRRPHPARRARRMAGVAGLSSMLLMTGYMTINGATSSAQAATPSTTATTTSKSS